MNHLLDNLYKLGTVVATRELIIHCKYATLLYFTPGGHVSQTILVVCTMCTMYTKVKMKIW